MGRRRTLIVAASISRPSPLLLCAAFAVANGRPPHAPNAPVNRANTRARQAASLVSAGEVQVPGRQRFGSSFLLIEHARRQGIYILMMPGSVRHNNSIHGRLRARRAVVLKFTAAPRACA